MSIDEINSLPLEEAAAGRQKALNDEQNHFIFSHMLDHGKERIVEIHSSPVTFQEKPALFSIMHDLTEHKQAEDELQRVRDDTGTARSKPHRGTGSS